MISASPVIKDLLLVDGGHIHILVLKNIGYAETTIIGSVVSESNQLSPRKIFG